MVATGLIQDETSKQERIQCKNSYRNDPDKHNNEDNEIIYIPLDWSDTSSKWTLFYEDNERVDCIDAFFIAIDYSCGRFEFRPVINLWLISLLAAFIPRFVTDCIHFLKDCIQF